MRLDHRDDLQTILLDPSIAVWTDAAPHVSRQNPTSTVQADAEHPGYGSGGCRVVWAGARRPSVEGCSAVLVHRPTGVVGDLPRVAAGVDDHARFSPRNGPPDRETSD
jgi:hypothetical protein